MFDPYREHYRPPVTMPTLNTEHHCKIIDILSTAARNTIRPDESVDFGSDLWPFDRPDRRGKTVERRKAYGLLLAKFFVKPASGQHPELPRVRIDDILIRCLLRLVEAEHVHISGSQRRIVPNVVASLRIPGPLLRSNIKPRSGRLNLGPGLTSTRGFDLDLRLAVDEIPRIPLLPILPLAYDPQRLTNEPLREDPSVAVLHEISHGPLPESVDIQSAALDNRRPYSEGSPGRHQHSG